MLLETASKSAPSEAELGAAQIASRFLALLVRASRSLGDTRLAMTAEPSWNPVLYEELRLLADDLMAGERAGHTLEPTALVHEAWLRLLQSRNASTLEHGAFLGLAAQAMRRILTDHARRRASAKRGGGLRRTTLEGKTLVSDPQEFALGIDAALTALELVDIELARVMELRFYAGCELAEIGELLGLSVRTVKRRHRFARAWLQQYMQKTDL